MVAPLGMIRHSWPRSGSRALRPLPLLACLACGAFGAVSAGQTAIPEDSNDAVSVGEIEEALERCRGELLPLIGGTEPVDSLYFGWFDRPYRRATLACAVKALAVLEYELQLRQLGNGAIDDRQLVRLLAWLRQAAPSACVPPSRAAVLPHRLAVTPDSLLALTAPAGAAAPPPVRFGFMDRATATRHDDWAGDFDLLACLGVRVIGAPAVAGAKPSTSQALFRHGHALGIAVVGDPGEWNGPPPSDPLPAGDAPPWFSPLAIAAHTLAELIESTGKQRPGDESVIPAAADYPFGESWGEALARRSLHRTTTGSTGAVVIGWAPSPGGWSYDTSPEQVRLAMWVHALGGQRLALLEGWRDLRDGSPLPYPSLTANPGVIEAVAHTALDMLPLDKELAAFDDPRRVLVVLADDCLHPRRPNRWSKPWAALFSGLAERQPAFDVVCQTRMAQPGALDRYPLIVSPPEDSLLPSVRGRLRSMRAGGSTHVVWDPASSSIEPVLIAVDRRLSEPDVVSGALSVGGLGGARPQGVLIFDGTGGEVALANTTGERSTVWITPASGERSRPLRDAIAGLTFARPDQGIELGPRQVRLLIPQ